MHNKSKKIKIISIGNSQGIRISKMILRKYNFSNTVTLEEKEEGILLRKEKNGKLTWEQTFKEMAKEKEDWSDLDNTLLDGIDNT